MVNKYISSLVTAVVPTSKKNPRKEKVTKITWHHMAGKDTALHCAKWHATDPNVNASANYYIGFNGEIVCGVEENYRAWTSSSGWNDHQAITIEISNDICKEPWTISDKALEAAYNLTVDICKRYNIEQVYYNGTKDAPLTLHKMFRATQCPGTYLTNLFETHKIEEEINRRLRGVYPAPTPTITETEPDYTMVVMDVIRGKYGNGLERKRKLTEEGYDYKQIQKLVNEYLKRRNK